MLCYVIWGQKVKSQSHHAAQSSDTKCASLTTICKLLLPSLLRGENLKS